MGVLWTFREVLDRLLGIVCGSVRQALRGERITSLPALVHNTCLLLAVTVAELSAETSSAEVSVAPKYRTVYSRVALVRIWTWSKECYCFSGELHIFLASV